MAKASREYIYGTNPAFEVLRSKKRKVYGAWLNQSSRQKPRMQKLVKLLLGVAGPYVFLKVVNILNSMEVLIYKVI